jgi:hypothetical protein
MSPATQGSQKAGYQMIGCVDLGSVAEGGLDLSGNLKGPRIFVFSHFRLRYA